MSERFDHHNERRLGFICECGTRTINPDGQCDDCFDRAVLDRQFEADMEAENLRFDRVERIKFGLGGAGIILGLLFLAFAIWSTL